MKTLRRDNRVVAHEQVRHRRLRLAAAIAGCVYKKTVEDAGDVIFGADERINKSDKPRGQLDISFNN